MDRQERVFRASDGSVVDAAAPFWGVFRQPILGNKWVGIVSATNFLVDILRIGLRDWTPNYLQEAKGFNLKEAGWSLSAFELAGIFGAYAAGWISDTVLKGRRGPVSVGFMLLLIACVPSLFFVPRGQVWTIPVVFVAHGFFVYGPQLLIAVAAADFATKAVASSVVGLTGLFGCLGASVCGVANRRAAHSLLPNFAGPVVAFTGASKAVTVRSGSLVWSGIFVKGSFAPVRDWRESGFSR